ncbi:MAG: hypothetical protein D6743_10630 [Calditrichaeota bacterium]|nr:MAG: hypothetical protein D6743_10630 [Calditrichota bacterium]
MFLSVFSLALVAGVFLLRSRTGYTFENKPGPAVVDGGTITGTVRFPKEYPEREKVLISKDPQVCGAFQYSEQFVVNEDNHGLKNVVVTLVNVDGKAPEKGVFQLDQNKCRYVPHVQAVPVGSTLEIVNSDGILHNVHAYFGSFDPKNTVFNKAQPKFLKRIKQVLDKPGIYYFKCDIHDHMRAYIAVMDQPYYAVSDEAGKFEITNVPPGTYKVQAWHEVLGTLEKEVQVQAGKTAEVNFDILPNE